MEFDTVDTNQQIIERTKQNCDEKNLLQLLQSTAMGEVVKSQINGDPHAIRDIILWVSLRVLNFNSRLKKSPKIFEKIEMFDKIGIFDKD